MIKTAALHLFSEQGYNGVSIDRIAGRAGVSKGLVYNYFDSKKALFHDVIMDALKHAEPLAEVLKRTDIPADQRLEAICLETIRYFRQQMSYWKVIISLMLHSDVMEHLPEEFLEQKGMMTDAYMRLMKELGVAQPMQETILLAAVLDGIGLQMMVAGPDHPAEQLVLDYLKKLKPDTNE